MRVVTIQLTILWWYKKYQQNTQKK